MSRRRVMMSKERMVAFSDGVIAVIITIMVLELKVPHGTDLSALEPLFPVFSSYVLSFLYVGIYWNNHHHLLQVAEYVNGSILWANLHLMFWLSLIPFTTAWLGENHAAAVPVAVYGIVLLLSAIAYTILNAALIGNHQPDTLIAKSAGVGLKGMLSILCYVTAIVLAFWSPWSAIALYGLVAFSWLIPERQIERELAQ
ncbi:MAG: TMEM175 family protein [Steroidobacteraceae bacterium]